MNSRFYKIVIIIICALLCLSVLHGVKSAGRKESADLSVHMSGFNKDLHPAERDDNYRTTYEIFVCSFCDSNGDGTGDINGIRSRLDYIADMGFNAIWLTPVHPSSTYHKYDADDYYAIDPAFGTMEDFEALLKECHDRGIRVYMDLVLNHTSEDHGWFRAASDYLHELPSGWEPDPSYCKYYDYYNFSREQLDGYTRLEGTEWYYESEFWSEMPDLNLRSEAVRSEIRDIMAFWLNKGVDGFRLDAVTAYFRDDTPANTEFLKFLTDTGRSIDPDCTFIGEAWTDRDTIADLYSSGIDSLFDFPFAADEGIIAQTIRGARPASDFVTEMVQTEQTYRNSGPAFIDAPFYTNHDTDRSAEYFPDDDGSMTKMAYAMNLFMTGNAFVYYGEEIGMTGSGKDDNRRAPMYWSDDEEDPDMCAGPPDMDDIHHKYPSLTEQMKDDMSLYCWFREVIRVRNAFPAIARGVTEQSDSVSDDAVAAFYRRSDTEDDLLIVMNLRDRYAEKDLTGTGDSLKLAAVLNTGEEGITYEGGRLCLPAYSIAVFTAG